MRYAYCVTVWTLGLLLSYIPAMCQPLGEERVLSPLPLSDFGPGLPDWSGVERDETAERDGDACALWLPGEEPTATLTPASPDWRGFGEFAFWADIAPDAAPVTLRVRLVSPDAVGADDGFVSAVTLRPGEWREVALPFWDFDAVGAPAGVGAIRAVEFLVEPLPSAPEAPIPSWVRIDAVELRPSRDLDETALGCMETDSSRWSGLIPYDEYVREGATCALWPDPNEKTWVSARRVPDDWSKHDALEFSIGADDGRTRELAVYAYTGDPPESWDAFTRTVTHYGQGWQDYRLSLWDFDTVGSPGWEHITAVTLIAGPPEVPAVPGPILVDGIRLVRAQDHDPLSLLDDSTEAWPQLMPGQGLQEDGGVYGAWGSPTTTPWIGRSRMPRDVSAYDALSLSVWSAEANGQEVRARLYAESSGEAEACYVSAFTIDWQGWQTVQMPFFTFETVGEPLGWSAITSLTLSADPGEIETQPGTLLALDDIALTKLAPGVDVPLLDASGLARWQGLAPATDDGAFATWRPAEEGAWGRTRAVPEDWTSVEELELAVHGNAGEYAVFWVFLESEDEDGGNLHGFVNSLIVDWEGWRTVRLRKADFAPHGRPVGWHHIQSVQFIVPAGFWNPIPLPPSSAGLGRIALRMGERGFVDEASASLKADAYGYTSWAKTTALGLGGEPPDALFINAICAGEAGDLWIGTEEGGLVQVHDGRVIGRLTPANGLPDEFVYAIAKRPDGKLYLGHARSGMSLFSPADGSFSPVAADTVGRHVWDIELDADGRAWVASDRGVAVIDADGSCVALFDSRHGLPCDPVLDLALAADGRVWAVPSVGGLCVLEEGRWRALEFADEAPLLNRVVVSTSGDIWAAGANGLVRVPADGGSPTHIRRPGPPAETAPKAGFDPASLPDFYITALLPTRDGVYLGTRHQGLFRLIRDDSGVWRPLSVPLSEAARERYITALTPTGDTLLVGTYGDGLYSLAAPESPPGAMAAIDLPTAASSPTEFTREALQARFPEDPLQPWAQYIGEDWETRGDWVGVYGNQFGCLCGMYLSNNGYIITNQNDRSSRFMTKLDIVGYLGQPRLAGDKIRKWVQWLTHPDPRILVNPQSENLAERRHSEWDDHGEAYGVNNPGPDLYFDLKLPAGRRLPARFCIALYFFAKNCHTEGARYADYHIQVAEGPEEPGAMLDAGDPRTLFADGSVLADARVMGHRAGVYQRFLLSGGHTYTFRIARNGSCFTALSAVLVDDLDSDFIITPEHLRENRDFVPNSRVGIGL